MQFFTLPEVAGLAKLKPETLRKKHRAAFPGVPTRGLRIPAEDVNPLLAAMGVIRHAS